MDLSSYAQRRKARVRTAGEKSDTGVSAAVGPTDLISDLRLFGRLAGGMPAHADRRSRVAGTDGCGVDRFPETSFHLFVSAVPATFHCDAVGMLLRILPVRRGNAADGIVGVGRTRADDHVCSSGRGGVVRSSPYSPKRHGRRKGADLRGSSRSRDRGAAAWRLKVATRSMPRDTDRQKTPWLDIGRSV